VQTVIYPNELWQNIIGSSFVLGKTGLLLLWINICTVYNLVILFTVLWLYSGGQYSSY